MEKTELKKQIRCKVTGEVQGVRYRDYSQREAMILGISGTAENLADGGVEVVAQGDEKSLKIFIEKLRAGSLSSRVSSIDVVWEQPKENFSDFRIIF